MSNGFLKVDKDLLFNSGLNPTEILIYAQVAEFIRNTGDCFMKDETFAEYFGVSPKTISRAFSSLEEKGWLIRDTKNVRGGKERHIYITNGQNDSCKTEIKEEPKDKLSIAQQTNCPLHNGQNDLIKDKEKENIIKEKDKLSVVKEMAHNLSNSDGSFKM